MSRLDILFAGSGEFGAPSLAAILNAGHRIALVITQPDKPAGRGNKLSPSPIARFAIQRNLPLLRTANINAEHPPAADVMVVIAFGQKIAQSIANHPRLGSINLHASLLPKYRGAAPINWAILRGEKLSGNSIIRLAERMDAGNLLGHSRLEIGELETAGELHDRLAADGAKLILKALDDLASGSAVETQQNDAEATLAPKLSRESARIDWKKTAVEIARQIRGLYPWPGCHVRLMDASGERGRLTLVRARPAGSAPGQPGSIADGGVIRAGDGLGVEIIEVQPEAKRPMSLAAYRNGHPWEAGMRLEAL